jgi:hypothetical protein
MGSSTVCLLTINLDVGRLQAATLGDSGIFVLGHRPGSGRLEVKFRTPQQEHEFGRPYQLGHFPHSNTPDVSGRLPPPPPPRPPPPPPPRPDRASAGAVGTSP